MPPATAACISDASVALVLEPGSLKRAEKVDQARTDHQAIRGYRALA